MASFGYLNVEHLLGSYKYDVRFKIVVRKRRRLQSAEGQ
jgi:hypothetical protein